MRNFSLLPILLAFSICLPACSSQDDPASIVEEKASSLNEPATVFQDTTEIIVERIQQEDTIVVGVIIDEENLMSPHDRQPGVAFVGAMNQLNETGGILGNK